MRKPNHPSVTPRREQVFDVASFRSEQVPGAGGYRFAAVERGSGGSIHAQIINAEGHEVAWAVGCTRSELIRDATQKAQARERSLNW